MLVWGTAMPMETEVIVLFLQEEDQVFSKEILPALTAFSQEENIELILRDPLEGMPSEITSTPAIVFFGPTGRAIYAGRYTQFSTIENFIRSSRVAPQMAGENCRNDVLTWVQGRTAIITSLKVTELAGNRPPDFDPATFETQLKKGIDLGSTTFQTQSKTCLERTDRTFYWDVHPYLDARQQLFLSYAVYSQFDCVRPVAESLQDPISGPWVQRDSLFQLLGQQLETIVRQTILKSREGDALSVLPASTPEINWGSIYKMPPAQQRRPLQICTDDLGPLPTQWQFAGPLSPRVPAIQFQFPAPLDRYAGEATEISGGLSLQENGSPLKGDFKVRTASLTMGMPGLDEKVHKKYIKIKRFPEAGFQFADLNLDRPLQWGSRTRVAIPGVFSLMKYRKPIAIDAELFPGLDKNGEAILIVSARFQLNITDDFGIDGPDGPDPARKTMYFNLNFLLRPA